MPSSAEYSTREEILDQYLSSGKWYSRQQLENFCNRELENRGKRIITSRTTIHNDLLEIENKYKIVISRKRKGRTIYYKYEDPDFSIYSRELTMKDRSLIKQAMELLHRFEGMPQFEWVEEMLARYDVSFSSSRSKPSIGFEDASFNKGMEHFSPLVRAINEKISIDVEYKPFGKESSIYTISPYYLKQYNNRWTLIGKRFGKDGMTNLPLDRILSFRNSGKKYEETDTNFIEYFEDSIGPTVTGECQTIEIWLAPRQLDYVETKPLHGSQRVLHKDESGGIVQYELKPNYELEQVILSFGENATVLSPSDLRERIKQRIEASMKKYQYVQNP